MGSLPFLYCTRTILSPIFSGSSLKHKLCKPLRTLKPSQTRRTHALEKQPEHGIPFNQSHTLSETPTESKKSTLTNFERSVFERLASDSNRTQSNRLSDNASGSINDPYDDLSRIFDVAIREQERQQQRQALSLVKKRAQYARTPYEKALDWLDGPETPRWVSDGLDEFRNETPDSSLEAQAASADDHQDAANRNDLEIACAEHRARIGDMLERARSDVEIWEVLERRLFSVAKELNDQMEEESDPPKPKRQKSKIRVKARERANVEDTAISIGVDTDTEHGHLQAPGGLQPVVTDQLLLLLQANYAYLCALALRLLRQRHAKSSYNLRILPQIKSLGQMSYVLGISTDLYNEILYVRWTYHSDLHGIADLLLEMINQGLSADRLTFALLGSIDRTRKKDMDGQRGRVLRAWWQLRGIDEAWIRVKQIYNRLGQEGKPYIETDILDTVDGVDDGVMDGMDMQAGLDAHEDSDRHLQRSRKAVSTKAEYAKRQPKIAVKRLPGRRKTRHRNDTHVAMPK